MAQTGLKVTTKLVSAAVDSFGPVERVNGRSTKHYRTAVTLRMEIGVPGNVPLDPQMQAMLNNTVSMTSEYWYGDKTDVPENPMTDNLLERALPGNRLKGEMVRAIDSLQRKLPAGRLAVRTTTSVSVANLGMSLSFETRMDLIRSQNQPVDARLLAVPDDYTEVGEPDDSGMLPPRKPTGTGTYWKASAWARRFVTPR
jgi:hypothetical protein